MGEKKKISLIDGSGFIFRAYYALPPLTSKNGLPIGAVLGFCNMLLKLIQEKESDKTVVIFDTAKKTFRSNIYRAYKANRGDPPEDLIPQFDIIREAVDSFKITRVLNLLFFLGGFIIIAKYRYSPFSFFNIQLNNLKDLSSGLRILNVSSFVKGYV